MDKYLIINADDFGMCRAANLAVMDLLKSGSITSSTIMAPCPWAYEACQFAKKNPQFAIGVHLTFTSEWATYRWSPVGTSNTDSLRDELGFMHPESIDVEKNADIKEVAAEIHAQINRLKALGLTPSHLDNHMGSLYGIEHSNDGLITFPGGLPIVDNEGVLVGAIGVSGSPCESNAPISR